MSTRTSDLLELYIKICGGYKAVVSMFHSHSRVSVSAKTVLKQGCDDLVL